MKSAYTLLIEPELAAKAEDEGGLSILVDALLRAHFETKPAEVQQQRVGRRKLTGYGMLAGLPGSVDEFIARKAEEKELER